MNSRVFGYSSAHSLTTIKLPSRKRSEMAEHMARLRIFFGKLYDQSRGCGPCALPPPFQSGERKLAMRARPVPFCFHNLRPAPETSPRVLVAEVPARRFARKLRTASWINGSLSGTSKTISGNSISPTSLLVKSRTLAVGITEPPFRNKVGFCLANYLPCRAAFLTTTTLPLAPGTAPRIINKLFSASTRATVSRLTVTRTSPMCPEDRMPLTTRDG